MLYHRALETLPNTKVILGHFLQKKEKRVLATPIRYRNKEINTAEVYKSEEKGSDVNIATEMLIDAYENRYDVAVLISNDSDLKAPVYHIRKRLRKKVVVLSPSKPLSVQLSIAATFQKQISHRVLKSSLFSRTLKDSKGSFKRPKLWS